MERLVDVVTPLGDALWFRQMTGIEALSGLFEYDVIFHSKQTSLSAKAMLGKDVTLKVETEGGRGVRYFNGICTRFGGGGREGEYQLFTAKLRPWLWLASRRSDCKIFQFKKVPDIVSEVLGKYGFPLSNKLKNAYREWEYCVQYQETDLNFVMRLMEHEGIYFHFEHAQGVHTLVLTDEISCHAPLPGRSTIKFFGVGSAKVAEEEHFSSWQVLEEVNSGEYIADDYDFEKPRSDLQTKRKNPMGHMHDAWERYSWPGGYVEVGDGESYSAVRLESLEAEHERTEGTTSVRTMAPGYLFNLERSIRADQNREYLAIAASYFFRDNPRKSAGSGGDGDATWHIQVTAQPTSVPYRPKPTTPKPLTSGPQTAVVVGPAGEEIYTDKYGRVKVQFFWDRYGKKDENSSCWVRVSHPWAGGKWGFIHIPRIGQEVIVDFIGGDPDYPMITGRVYNADQMPPYGLPDNKTASGIKSRSTKGGSDTDFNEIRMEDLKGKEQLYVHAQRNFDTVVELDESHIVGKDRDTRIKENDSRFVEKNDKHVVNQNQTNQINVNQDTTVNQNQNITVGAAQTVHVGASRSLTVGAALHDTIGADHKQEVGGAQSISVGGAQTVAVGTDQTVSVGGGRSTMVGRDDKTVGKGSASFSVGENYGVTAGKTYSETCFTRKADVKGTDTTEILMGQTETISVQRAVTVNGEDSLKVKGISSTDVTGAYSLQASAASIKVDSVLSLNGALVSISSSGVITVTGGSIMVTGPVTMIGAVTVVGALTVAGVVSATSVVSPVYSPGAGNML
jgi:type VI secretion system secreted protein VgrG